MRQMSFGGRAPPGPVGGAYIAPQITYVLKLGASPHGFGVRIQSVPVLLLFPIPTLTSTPAVSYYL